MTTKEIQQKSIKYIGEDSQTAFIDGAIYGYEKGVAEVLDSLTLDHAVMHMLRNKFKIS